MSNANITGRRRLAPIDTAAKFLGVTPRSVRNYISKGLFPAYRIPGTRGVRVDLDEINKAMRLIPATIAHTGVLFGPNAKIIDLQPQPNRAEVITPEAN